MATEAPQGSKTRLLFLGDDALADGFRLIGFETVPNPTPEEVERILRVLLKGRERAFVIVDDDIMRSDVASLRQVRREGGRILVVAIPRLNEPPRLSGEVADRVAAMFGQVQVDSGRK